jgi:hypothetical protein
LLSGHIRKVEKLISENFTNENEIDEIVKLEVDGRKCKIYLIIHNKNEDIDFEFRKR